MYSRKSRDNYGEYVITPPPGYDGSRFGYRSDGRDDSFPPYDKRGQMYVEPEEKKEESCKSEDVRAEQNRLFPFMKNGIGHEELLLIALLIVMVGEKNSSPELVLILGLLLCI